MGTIAGGPQSVDGAPVVASEAFAYSGTEVARFQGSGPHVFPAGATSSIDMLISTAARLQGGYYWVQNCSLGDVVSLSVVDVDGVISPAGTVVSQYVTDMPVVPWDHQQELESPTAGLIPAGLYLRITYASVGATDVNLGVTYRWYVIP
jgi:hypothetical protein